MGVLQEKKNIRALLKLRRASFFSQFITLPMETQAKIYDKMSQEVLKIIKAYQKRAISSTPLTVSGFYPIKEELNCLHVLHFLADRGFRIALPVTLERIPTSSRLEFREYTRGLTKLVPDVYKVPSPEENSPTIEPDVILTPLLGFDKSLRRIGYGGGYYDRTFKEMEERKKRFVSLGMCWEIQKEENIPFDFSHDQLLDYVVTEKNTYTKHKQSCDIIY